MGFLLANVNEVDTYSSNWSNFSKTLGQFFYLVIVFIVILILAYFTTKWFSTGKYVKKGNSNIKILESAFINQHCHIFLVHAGDKYMLIGASKEKIYHLADINEESLVFEDEKPIGKIPFEKYLNQFILKKKE